MFCDGHEDRVGRDMNEIVGTGRDKHDSFIASYRCVTNS